jgi:GDPmannose 4,6-dehydratase
MSDCSVECSSISWVLNPAFGNQVKLGKTRKHRGPMKTALITGITGQDGSYLAEYLLHQGYVVHGIIRRASNFNTQRIDHIYRDPHSKSGENLFLHYGDLGSTGSLGDIIYDTKPDEVYHLAAQSHVKVSFEMPEYTGDTTGMGTTRVLEAVRRVKKDIKFYQASTSELFGSAKPPQNEQTPFYPRSPYGVAKLYAYWMVVNYREAYNIFATNGILFNHESARRGMTFVTRKITAALAAIKAGLQDKLYLGNLDSNAPEYIEAQHLLLQQDQPGDYVIGTGESHSIREFLDESFGYADMDWHKYVEVDPRYFRPTEVDYLLADPTKANQLGWEPKVKFHELVRIMVDADLELLGLEHPGEGKKIIDEKFNGWHKWEDQVISMGR